MARIRTIKPEFWTNERVMECSMPARLLFIGMWNFADDCGRLSLSPKTLKAQIMPSDDVTADDILGMLRELSANGLVLAYEVGGKRYLQITGWQHQRIDKPQPGKHPAPSNGYSETILGMVGDGRELMGVEGRRPDPIPVDDDDEDDASARDPVKQPWELEPCHDLARQVAEVAGCADEFEFTGWGGATFRVKQWLENGWKPELVIASVREQAAKKRDGPARSIQYFEPGIASAIAKANQPLPKVVEIQGKTVEVSNAKPAGNSATAVAKRIERELIEASGLDSEPYQPSYLRLPAR